MRQNEKSHAGTIVVSILLIASAAALLAAAKQTDGFAEWYSTTVYPVITGSVGALAGLASFSVSEYAVIILPVFIVLDLIICIFTKKIRTALSHILITASILFFLYSANCGVNYYRDPFVHPDALSEAAFTEQQLTDYCEFVIDRIEECEAADGTDADYPDGSDLRVTARNSMRYLSESCPSLRGYYPDPKQLSFLSEAFSDLGISGIYSPFTVEANINGQIPGMSRPFTACHELSHLRGYMNEGEANYIAWLACINSNDTAFNRSGWLNAWLYAGGTLRRVDPDQYARLSAELPEKAAAEIEEHSQFWSSHEGKASEMHDRMNDAYLKANGQSDGIQSYGMLTTLMLVWYTGRSA